METLQPNASAATYPRNGRHAKAFRHAPRSAFRCNLFDRAATNPPSRWPEAAAPGRLALWKWLGRAVQEGRGTRTEPFLYQLPGMAEKWHQDFLASFRKRLEGDAAGKAPPGP